MLVPFPQYLHSSLPPFMHTSWPEISHMFASTIRDLFVIGKYTTPNYFKIVQKHSLCLISSIFNIGKFKYPIIHLRASSGQVFLQLQICLSLAEKDILKDNRVWLNDFLAKKKEISTSWSRASSK